VRKLASIALAVLALAAAAHAEPPRVVASIAPVHSLVANVMVGIGEPALVVRGFGSPHGYQLRPSDAAALAEADVIFWVGEALETFLVRPLSALPGQARIVTLMDLPDMVLWRSRTGGVWDVGGEHDAHGEHDEHGAHGPVDPHLWLAPGNAVVIVDAAAMTLGDVDPANAATYRANAARTVQRIEAMTADMKARLAGVRHTPFVVFHDGYQYLERAFGLNAVGAVVVSPDRPTSARRLSDLRARMRELGAVCVFVEPQVSPALVDVLIEGTSMGRGVLDPLGAELPPGPDSYFDMMRSNADALARCLSGAG
jgi:zinc transport system substrate-binding protein